MTHDRTHLDEAELALLGITGNGPTARFMRALIAHLRASQSPPPVEGTGCGTCGSPCVKCGTMLGVSLHIFDGECYCDACSSPKPSEAARPNCPKCGGSGEVLDGCPSGDCWTTCPACARPEGALPEVLPAGTKCSRGEDIGGWHLTPGMTPTYDKPGGNPAVDYIVTSAVDWSSVPARPASPAEPSDRPLPWESDQFDTLSAPERKGYIAGLYAAGRFVGHAVNGAEHLADALFARAESCEERSRASRAERAAGELPVVKDRLTTAEVGESDEDGARRMYEHAQAEAHTYQGGKEWRAWSLISTQKRDAWRAAYRFVRAESEGRIREAEESAALAEQFMSGAMQIKDDTLRQHVALQLAESEAKIRELQQLYDDAHRKIGLMMQPMPGETSFPDKSSPVWRMLQAWIASRDEEKRAEREKLREAEARAQELESLLRDYAPALPLTSRRALEERLGPPAPNKTGPR